MTVARKQPQEIVVYDGDEACSYLDGRTARMPLRLPLAPLNGPELDYSLAAGDRRSGAYLYRTQCPHCCACEPIRVPVSEFRPSRTDRRVKNRGDRLITLELGPAVVDSDRVRLFNLHRNGRGLARRERGIDLDGYTAFLVETCCSTFEIRYWLDDDLIGVAVCDRGERSLNAVYCYFDPQYEKLSPGVYSVLKQIELCEQWGLQYLYLGLYIAQCKAMSYKDRYRPHERLINGQWRRFEEIDPR